MMIFSGNKILVSDSNSSNSKGQYKFSGDDIAGLEEIYSSGWLPENWQALPEWTCVKEPVELPEGKRLITLRDFWYFAGDEAFTEASGAMQFAVWFRDVKYCSHCGGNLAANEHDFGRKCENCGTVFYAPISPAVITAVERGGKLLLAHNSAWVENRYSVIAGFVEPGERLEEAVSREIREEVNISVKNIKYFGSQSWPFPNSLMMGFTAEYESGDIQPDGTEIVNAGFFSPDEILNMNIPGKASIARKLIDNFLKNHGSIPDELVK